VKKNELRDRFFSLLHLSDELGEPLDIATIVEEFQVTKDTIARWSLAYSEAQVEERVLTAMDQEVVEAFEAPKVQINKQGVIEVITSSPPAFNLETSERLVAFKEKVAGLQLLNSEVQGAAGHLVDKILRASEDPNLTARDLSNLVAALTSIQNAFFNKPTTNIQVNNTTGDGKSLLSSFQARMRS